ncbi:MAG: isoprenylcysteine carboxylmethyltransferase family protein [Opitutae bacterium]|nr:isoprenylcysteine carboxylmethyltransferase family protein [Opitutae bacterium]
MPAATKEHAGVIAFPPLILAAHVVAGGVAYWLCPIPLLPSPFARTIGVILVVVAGAQAFWAARIMKRAGTNVRPSLPTTAIVAAGPYRYTRNPMYLSLCLLYLGLSLLINGVLPVLFLVPLALTLHFGVIRREERYLAAKFGETYLAYQRRVRRWL